MTEGPSITEGTIRMRGPNDADRLTSSSPTLPAAQPLTPSGFALRIDPSEEPALAPAVRRAQEKARRQAEAEERARAKAEAKARAQAEAALAPRRPKGKVSRKILPAWSSSLMVHGALVLVLLTFTITIDRKRPEISLDAGLDTTVEGEQPMALLADPIERPSDELASPNPNGMPELASAQPVTAPASEAATAVDLQAPGMASPLSTMPSAPMMDLAGGGLVAGDVARGVGGHGEALDQLAREILRHLNQHKVTVAWMFDESESMRDDQQEVKARFDRVSTDIQAKLGEDASGRNAEALRHAVVGFGRDVHFELEPTTNIRAIFQAIDRLKVDTTGAENTLHAFARVIAKYEDQIDRDRRLLIVLITDESGDDGAILEATLQLCRRKNVPVYVVGRQSLLGQEYVHIEYTDPQTKEVYFPVIRRGPETADLELLQFDGILNRSDEQPSGFAPYDLARLTKETGGIYFLLPNEEFLRRSRHGDKRYPMDVLKEYVPDYESRPEYVLKRAKSELRKTLYTYIHASKSFSIDNQYPTDARFESEAGNALRLTRDRLTQLREIHKTLQRLKPQRDREPERRWQAAFDLMQAQVSLYQVKVFEMQCCLERQLQDKPKPTRASTPDRTVEWEISHGNERFAPVDLVEKKYAEAEVLLKRVIERYAGTPWADLAQYELDRGMSVRWAQFDYNPKRSERDHLVPKY